MVCLSILELQPSQASPFQSQGQGKSKYDYPILSPKSDTLVETPLEHDRLGLPAEEGSNPYESKCIAFSRLAILS